MKPKLNVRDYPRLLALQDEMKRLEANPASGTDSYHRVTHLFLAFHELYTVYDEGEARGYCRGLGKYVLRELVERGFTVTDEQQRRVSECVNPAQMDAWWERSGSAGSAEEVFG